MSLILVFLIIHYMQTHNSGDMEEIREIYISEVLGEHEVAIKRSEEITKRSGYDHLVFPLKIKSLLRTGEKTDAIRELKRFESSCSGSSMECINPLVHVEISSMMYALTGRKIYLENTQQWELIFRGLKAEQIRLRIRNKEALNNDPIGVLGLYGELERAQAELSKVEKTRFYLNSWVIVHPDRNELFIKLPSDVQAELIRQGFGIKEGQINNF